MRERSELVSTEDFREEITDDYPRFLKCELTCEASFILALLSRTGFVLNTIVASEELSSF